MPNRVESGLLAWTLSSVEKTVSAMLLAGLLVCHTYTFPVKTLMAIHGEWADKALSDVLSERYGRPVNVKNARIAGWSEVSFGSLEVRSEKGQTLIRSSRGELRLKKLDLSKKAVFETELDLRHVTFFHDYYKDSPTFRPWNRILKKPFHIDELVLGVTQNKEETLVQILKSDSRDVILGGRMLLDASGQMHDALRVNLSPWMVLRALI